MSAAPWRALDEIAQAQAIREMPEPLRLRLEALIEAEAECVEILRERLRGPARRFVPRPVHAQRTRKAIAVIRALRREIARLS